MRQKILLAVAIVLLPAVLGAYWWAFFRSPSSFRSPGTLERLALGDDDPQVRQEAAVELARHPDKPLAHLRRVFEKSDDPQVRAAVALGLGHLEDWESMPALLDALESNSAKVRANAALSVNKMLGIDYRFRGDAPANERERKIKAMRAMYEHMNKMMTSRPSSE